MENNVLRVKAVLHDLQKFATKENEISSLTRLNEIISSSQEDTEFLYNSGGIDMVMSFLESDSKLANICLKILANASKKHEKVRSKLLENNIFHLLAVKLRNETDFSSSNFILYSALIVLLLHGSGEAQNQLRRSGCLSSVLYILNSILDEVDGKPLPSRSTELIIYVIIASNKEPRHIKNQTEIGWLTPKILAYLGKQTVFSGSDQLQVIKCFWLLLKAALDRNEQNQQIFLDSSGLSVLFRSLQSIIEEGNCEEMADLLIKMTGVLVKFKSNKEFLYQSSSYCPVVILGALLKTSNTLIIQQIIIFLDSLGQEFPQAIDIMRDKDILRRIKKAKVHLLKTKAPAEPCLNLWKKVKIVDETQTSQKENWLSQTQQFNFSLKNQDQNLRETALKLSLLKTHCVVHNEDTINFHKDLEPSFSQITTIEAIESKGRVEIPSRLKFSEINIISRKELKEKRRKFRKVISQNLSNSFKGKENNISFVRITGRRIMQIFKSFLSFFIGGQTNNWDKNFLH